VVSAEPQRQSASLSRASLSPNRVAYAALAVIAAVALAVRVWYLFGPASPGGEFTVVDPDQYARQGDMLARHGQGWSWSLDAVKYFQFVKAPLYIVFLSLVRLYVPGEFPFSATVAQAVLNTVTIAAVFWIAMRLHSAAAGAIGAALFALYLPSILGAAAFSQEAVYIPLATLACAALIDASTRGASATAWALAGAAFGLAALARSLAIYYVPLAAVLLVSTAF
jgi:4-amino-4-deoxy-L-arabinose transferase-like glycosyltransferase